jgi:hydroxymethylpyrimidine/phosphomethylpyrimidine kinase
VQGDLKTFSALGAYGMAVITALTAQNGQGVLGVWPVEPEVVRAQLDAVLSAAHCDAIKIGMLSTDAVVHEVAEVLARFPGAPIVLDPVIMSSSGVVLLEPSAVGILKRELLPMTTVLTPNRAEASQLLGVDVVTEEDAIHAATQLCKLGPKHVLVTGGDSSDGNEVVDAWCDGTDVQILRHARVETIHTRGTGCALASAICVGLAKGVSAIEAVRQAREYVRTGLVHAVAAGSGRGPVNHLHRN